MMQATVKLQIYSLLLLQTVCLSASWHVAEESVLKVRSILQILTFLPVTREGATVQIKVCGLEEVLLWWIKHAICVDF
jgi:predicted membrane channel-forming protein YqfA (hemolysin III family)